MSKSQKELFLKITDFLVKIPDDVRLPSGETLSSHVVAYAISMFDDLDGYYLEVVDGWYLDRWNHSWLIDEIGNVFDVYPVGMLTSLEGYPIFVAKEIAKTGVLYQSVQKRQEEFRQMIVQGEDPPLDPDEVGLDVVRKDSFYDDVAFLQSFF